MTVETVASIPANRASDAVAQPSPVRRYLALDGMRGLAAFAVVLYHAGRATGLRWLAPQGDLAVDFFFVLSGFVLAHAYGQALTSGRTTPLQFLRVRFRRLWPMVALGTAIGAVVAAFDPSTLASPANVAAATIFGFLLLPDLMPGAASYPLNPPHWSVAVELVVNYGYAIVAPRLSHRAVFMGTCALAMAAAVYPTIPSRAAFGFAAGVALFRARERGSRPSASPALLSMLLGACLCWPTSSGETLQAVVRLFVFPAIVWLSAGAAIDQRAERVCRWSGRLSYPIYALHYPILMLVIAR